jgi:hypothetical protein
VPSKARKHFDESADDVDRLLEIHRDLGGDKQGRRFRLEVLNKAAIVLITAIWEAYCEDLAAEALENIVTHAPGAPALPKDLKKQIARELKELPNELAVWDLADNSWRTVLRNRLAQLTQQRNKKLNTPKSDNIQDLFESAIGLKEIATAWSWNKMSSAKASKKLDKYVTLRGDIAHRGSGAGSCYKSDVESYFGHVKQLVARTGGKVNTHVKGITGQALW